MQTALRLGGLIVAASILMVTAVAWGQATRPAMSASPHQLAQELSTSPGGMLAVVVALERDEEKFADSRDLWLDLLATHLIFVGDHRKAAQLDAQAYAHAKGRQGESDGSELAGYQPRPAVDTIVRLSKDRRVLMLNEEHRSSRERAFAHELLEPLRQAGFTHLALETIGRQTDAIEQRRYPLNKDGFYTQDPILGDLVRRAAEMGMGIVAYEAEMKKMPPDDGTDPMFTTNWREQQQAENLAKFLRENPDARVIVWSGRHHMSEDAKEPGGGGPVWTPMGGIFKRITDIDPLTIDLMVMNESTPETEHRTYRFATAEGLVNEPVIFMNEQDEPWSPLQSLDAAVFFPRTEWHNDRPGWLTLGGTRVVKELDWSQTTDQKPTPNRPLVIEARLKGEPGDAVPLDRVIWRGGEAPPVLLRPGCTYELQLRDPEGQVLAERALEVAE